MLVVLKAMIFAEILGALAFIGGAIALFCEGTSAVDPVEPPKTSNREKYCTFDEALEYLKISESKLERLVSEGDIRAFREKDQMKFMWSDVERIPPFGQPEITFCKICGVSTGLDGTKFCNKCRGRE